MDANQKDQASHQAYRPSSGGGLPPARGLVSEQPSFHNLNNMRERAVP